MYSFEPPLEIGRIISRPNRFIMKVEKENEIFTCHCPSTGKIGNISLDGLPCLLSVSCDKSRKTAFTVEAISVDGAKSWVGINQNAVNRYVEHFFRNGLLEPMVRNGAAILREQKIRNSKLDFRIGDVYVEVKMPLMYLSCAVGDTPIPERSASYFERFVRHVTDMADSLRTHKAAILLLCFVYDAPTFKAPPATEKNRVIKDAVLDAVRAGVKIWQMNMGVDRRGVILLKYFDITQLFL
ncbi:MAG: DNA/RNA nuclease SfsA [Holosporaceae bacterium]|jgi:sugar fermentation stimulation protein A|nr:DNA/RNA nuclease SfsA [Holosporaceae bacterium]